MKNKLDVYKLILHLLGFNNLQVILEGKKLEKINSLISKNNLLKYGFYHFKAENVNCCFWICF